jgi:hypothetical protein
MMQFVKDVEADNNITSKLLTSKIYAQNFYAALCNTTWRKPSDISHGLWSVTWRTAGGIVAGLRDQNEDYADWYCSGIGLKLTATEDGVTRTEVSEGTVTDEIVSDFSQIGWKLITE